MLTALRSLVWLASALVPRSIRADWRRKWDRSILDWWLLNERGELQRPEITWMLRHCWSCLAEALWLRFDRDRFFRGARSPFFPIAVALVLIAATGLLTRGFTGVRSLFEPLPVKDSGALVSIRYTGAAGDPYGVPGYLVPLWRAKSKHLLGLAAYWHPKHAANAWVTSDFFPVLGVTPAVGRLFTPQDTDAAILSDGAWRRTFRSDPDILQRTVAIEGRTYRIVGVLPPSFWMISEEIEIWTPFFVGPSPTPGMPLLVGAIGRLKHDVNPWTLRQELLSIGREAHSALPRAPEVAWFQHLPDHGIPLYICGMIFALTMAAGIIIKGRPLLKSKSGRYWLFFVAKLLFSLLLPMLLWIEAGSLLRLRLPVDEFWVDIGLAMLTIAIMVATAFCIWWSYADQRLRCPVCLQKLALPVRIGSWSSVLEPVSTELMCDRGHGVLCEPESESGEAGKWTSLDSSWQELFGGGGPKT